MKQEWLNGPIRESHYFIGVAGDGCGDKLKCSITNVLSMYLGKKQDTSVHVAEIHISLN